MISAKIKMRQQGQGAARPSRSPKATSQATIGGGYKSKTLRLGAPEVLIVIRSGRSLAY